ncbi:MAG: amino acid ABC transporter substrate-binding protein [Chromatiaceae bacterium]
MRLGNLTRIAYLLLTLAAPPILAGEILEGVKSRGVLRCGVSEGIPGFSEQDPDGRWRGLDADFCRAVAAAVIGNAEKVTFVPLSASERFPALQARKIDLLARNTTWTLVREAVMGVQFAATLFYDGQTFMVPTESPVQRPADLNGATICVQKGTTSQRNLQPYFARQGLSIKPLVIDSAKQAAEAFFKGRCQAYSSDSGQLAGARILAPEGRQAYRILPDLISSEPLAPAVWGGDQQWASMVRWVLFSLIHAEVLGITRSQANNPPSDYFTSMLSWDEREVDSLDKAIGVPKGWGKRVIAAVGNYGELFDRNLGAGSEIGLERGLNRLWLDGGLMYAPPYK